MILSEDIVQRPEDLIQRYGVTLERWQWEKMEDDLPGRLRILARSYTPCFVYFVQEVDGEPVKIGVAADPEKRLAQLQTGNPTPLAIRQLICGDASVETRLHRLWTRQHALIRDEWFDYPTRVLALARHIAERQMAVLERGLFVKPELARCVDESLRNHKAILGK